MSLDVGGIVGAIVALIALVAERVQVACLNVVFELELPAARVVTQFTLEAHLFMHNCQMPVKQIRCTCGEATYAATVYQVPMYKCIEGLMRLRMSPLLD